MSQFGKKSAKVYHCLFSSTEQLQVVLWTVMFIMFGFNNEKSLHTLPLRSVSFLSLHLYPSLFNPSVSSPESVWLLKLKEWQSVPTQIVTHTHTHTHSHTHRQSTLGKYMVNNKSTLVVDTCYFCILKYQTSNFYLYAMNYFFKTGCALNL
jgi:hypothetical protein